MIITGGDCSDTTYSGGGGGAGAMVNGVLTNVSGASIIGGEGGSSYDSGAGAGGDGVAVVSVGSRFENHGTVTGGDGGQANNASLSANAGAGIRLGHDAYVVNAGVVKAGVSYGPDAAEHTGEIEIVGDNATLELRAGSVIEGAVRVASGVSGASLLVGGADDSTLDIGTGIYSGFETLTKTGSSVWTLTGDTTANTPWLTREGTLSISSAGSLGSTVSSLTIDGGTLATYGTFDLAKEETIVGAGGATIDTQSGIVTLTEVVSGTGALTKAGAGEILVTGRLEHTGGPTVSAGILQIGNGGMAGAISGNVSVASGATLEFNHSNVETYEGNLSGTGMLKIDSPGDYPEFCALAWQLPS